MRTIKIFDNDMRVELMMECYDGAVRISLYHLIDDLGNRHSFSINSSGDVERLKRSGLLHTLTDEQLKGIAKGGYIMGEVISLDKKRKESEEKKERARERNSMIGTKRTSGVEDPEMISRIVRIKESICRINNLITELRGK